MTLLHPDRLFPHYSATRKIARQLYEKVRDVPIVSPHGHTDPVWWGDNASFANATDLLVTPDHYVTRMLISQGLSFETLGLTGNPIVDPRAVWRIFAKHYHLFQGTPSRLWIDHALSHVFGLQNRLSAKTADDSFDAINDSLAQPDFLPRALYDRFNIEVIATTDSAVDTLPHHDRIRHSNWSGRVVPTYRPDSVTNPDTPGFSTLLDQLSEQTGCDTHKWDGYLEAHRVRRKFFKTMGATATDHGHANAQTADLALSEAEALFNRVRSGRMQPGDVDLFQAQMLTEYARMSCEDGLVMQLHVGSHRDHNATILQKYGQNRGFDIPVRVDFVRALKPLLDAVGFEPNLRIILFTLDESNYARELAPLAGAYPCLLLGPPWWFHDSVEGMYRFRKMTLETAGFYNTAGFNDDTRALCSIPARHDVARRVDCAVLADLVTSHRIDEEEAFDIAPKLANGLARSAYNLQENDR